MIRQTAILTLLLVVVLAPPFARKLNAAERFSSVRVFKSGEYSPVAVSLSPRGNLLVRGADSPVATWMDGYSMSDVTLPEPSNFRVYESRSGQLWTFYREGILLFDRNRWSRHPIPEIRAELGSNQLRPLRQIPLIPAEVNHVLFLLPDRLMEYDSGSKRINTLKKSSDTQLGSFNEMHESAAGDVWISGTNGFAKIAGPVRHINSNSVFEEFIVNDAKLKNLQHPFLNPAGFPTAATISSSGRYIVSFEDGKWSSRKIENDPIRQAWQGWDNVTWALSYNALIRAEMKSARPVVREAVAGLQYDVAVETNGVFWVATSEGLMRYAPPLWRSPRALSQFEGPVHGMISDVDDPGAIWLATSEALVWFKEDRIQTYPWPEDIDLGLRSPEALFQLADGRLAVSIGSNPLLFHKSTAAFATLILTGKSLRIVGQGNDGELFMRAQSPGKPFELLQFDGAAFSPLFDTAPDLAQADIQFVKQVANGDIWIGNSGGLLVWRHATSHLDSFAPQPGLSLDRATCMTEVAEGKLWCGGHGQIFELQGKNWVSIWSGSDRVNSIQKDSEGIIWVATANGLHRFQYGAWIENSTDQGLPNPTVYDVKKDPLGNVWACTSRGISKFHPDADLDPPRTLEPFIRNEQAPSTSEPTLIAFQGVDRWDYTSPNELLFSYKLDEAGWSPFTNTLARVFPNLSSGRHHLEVRSMDRNGNKSIDSATLDFAVILPWFKDPRLIAVSVLALALVLFLGGVAVNRHLQLKRSYAEVEKIVAQRTKELERANQELLLSQKMRAIGTMAAGIAHDFNNILSIIKGSAQIIETNVDDKDKIKTRVKRIETVVEQGASIVKALLGLGRLNEKDRVECQPVDLLEEVARLVSDRFQADVILEVQRNGDLPKVSCSREAIHQMLINLILNAADAVGAKGIVQLNARKLDQLPAEMVLPPARSSEYVELSVSDTGSGIPEETLPRIFEPFYTTKAFSTRRGTGLGLSMVYELAKGMGYGLSVETEVGRGSRFNIYLPLCPDDQVPSKKSG